MQHFPPTKAQIVSFTLGGIVTVLLLKMLNIVSQSWLLIWPIFFIPIAAILFLLGLLLCWAILTKRK